MLFKTSVFTSLRIKCKDAFSMHLVIFKFSFVGVAIWPLINSTSIHFAILEHARIKSLI